MYAADKVFSLRPFPLWESLSYGKTVLSDKDCNRLHVLAANTGPFFFFFFLRTAYLKKKKIPTKPPGLSSATVSSAFCLVSPRARYEPGIPGLVA